MFISLVLAVVMSSVVKLFDTQQKLYKTLGFDIYQSQSCHSKCSISIKSLFFLISSMQLFISTTAFFLFEARTVDEYGMSFYISITIFSVSINITTIAWKMDEIFVLLRNYGEFIDKSQFLFEKYVFNFWIIQFFFRKFVKKLFLSLFHWKIFQNRIENLCVIGVDLHGIERENRIDV